MKLLNLEGKTVGRWKVIGRVYTHKRRTYWKVKCLDCGLVSEVESCRLRNGLARCVCYSKTPTMAQIKKKMKTNSGELAEKLESMGVDKNICAEVSLNPVKAFEPYFKDKKAREIFAYRFGRNLTYRKIGGVMNLSGQRIHQIVEKEIKRFAEAVRT